MNYHAHYQICSPLRKAAILLLYSTELAMAPELILKCNKNFVRRFWFRRVPGGGGVQVEMNTFVLTFYYLKLLVYLIRNNLFENYSSVDKLCCKLCVK